MAIILGIDYGEKKIGFAVGQTITKNTTPLKVIYHKGDFWNNIDKIFKHWRPRAVVIGKPELADKKKHPLEKKIEIFIIDIKTRYNVNIYRENEAYSSFEARTKKKNKAVAIDAEAAAVILESWIRSQKVVNVF